MMVVMGMMGGNKPFDSGLLINGDFETAGLGGADIFSGWTESVLEGSIQDETALLYQGKHACKITSGASLVDYVFQVFTVIPGDEYTLSGMARGNGTSAPRYAVRDQISTLYIVDKTAAVSAAASYQAWSKDFLVPAGCTSMSIRLYGPATNGAAGWYDNVSLKKK